MLITSVSTAMYRLHFKESNVKRYLLITLLIMITLLTACGSDSDDVSEEQLLEKSVATSQLAFYLPDWFDHTGEIVIRSETGNIITSLSTSSLNSELVALDANQIIVIEYIPNINNVRCPVTIGCGSPYNYYHEDTNDNNVIDQNEIASFNTSFAAKVLLSPGNNKVYFSLLSLLESSLAAKSHLKSLSITPNYHQTHVDQAHSNHYQQLANASYYSLFASSNSSEAISLLKTSLNSLIINNEISASYLAYSTEIDRYLTEQMDSNSEIENINIINEKFRLNRLLTNEDANLVANYSHDLNDRILLEQLRNIIAFINIQDQKYSNEINEKVTEISTMINSDSEKVITVFSDVLANILNLYSPVNDTPAGIYHYEGLDINYVGSPYSWVITGVYQGVAINLELVIPQWRISAARGDFFNANISGHLSSDETTLSINTDELLLKFDGVDDIFTEDKAQTAIFNLITNISLINQNGQIDGRLSIEGARVENEQGELFSILNQFGFTGLLTGENLATSVSLMAIKHSNGLVQDQQDFMYDLLLDLPSSGSSDLRLSISGLEQNFELLDQVNLALKMQGNVLELEFTQNNGSRELLAKGVDGRWLTLKQQGKDYAGALYFGDIVIGVVITVRGVPGLLFPNGDFHSIF